MNDPVYILIRTSGRPEFFKSMFESIKKQTYNNIITIVHSDDPRDEYVKGDIIIRGQVYGPSFGNGSYNLYNNRLLQAIPKDKPGWYHFIDDDDMYAADDVIEKLVKLSKKDHVNVGKVQRWNKTIWPKSWKKQKSFQTECFFIHTDYKSKSKWWGHRGGDHNYSKQLTKILPINWIEGLLICKAQEGKGHGNKFDKGGVKFNYKNVIDDKKQVPVLCLQPYRKGGVREHLKQGRMSYLRYKKAFELEKLGIIKITYHQTYTEY